MRLNTEWKKRCQPVRAEPAFQHYCAQCAVFPSPTLCLHLDSLKLKMATWSAVRSHKEPLEPAISSTKSTALKENSYVHHFHQDIFFQLNGPTRIFCYMKQKQISHYSTKAGSLLLRLLHQYRLRSI